MGRFFRVLSNTKDFYRKIEFGICPKCGVNRFCDYRIVFGKVTKKCYSGKSAYSMFEKILENLSHIKSGSKSKQNYYYGDFKLTNKKDTFGNPIYLQLRKNFNNDIEVLGEVKTKVVQMDNGEVYDK